MRFSARSLAATAALLAILAGAGCSNDDDGAGVLELAKDGPGTCLDVPDKLGETVDKLPTIECSKPHTHEIYAVVKYDKGDVFPGLEELNKFSEQACVGAFEPYVGISSFDSKLTFSWLTPTLGSWNNHDDRSVLCVLTNFNAEKLDKSMKSAKT